jgi:phage terminase large subunit-like protein
MEGFEHLSEEELTVMLREMERLTEQLEVYDIERDLRKFIPVAWPVIEPHRPYIPNWHIDAIADHLMACTEGHIRNLIINIPPRHMKSQTVSIFWPAWEWCRFPQVKGLFVSYARNLVIRDAVKTRRVIQSPWYQNHWGHVFKLQSDQNVKSHFENDQGGVRLVGSMDAGVTGEGGDRLCIDDPLKLEDADNKAQLEHVADFWDSVLSSRLNDPMTGIRVIIMQRLNARDLTGHVLAKEHGWTHLFLPTEFEPERVCRTFYHRNDYRMQEVEHDGKKIIQEVVEVKPVEFVDPRTVKGELLNPLRFGPKEVADAKIRNGPWHYAGQQQQRPVPQGGGMFQKSWWRFFIHPPDQVEMQGNAAQAWDMAFKKTDDSSYVVGHVGAMVGPNIYLLYERRDRMDFPTALDAVRSTTFLFPWVGPKLIEDKANGSAVVDVLTKEIPGLIARPNNDGTHAMANAVTYLVQAGNVYLPGKRDEFDNLVPAHAWVQEFIDELEAYPRGEYSDRVSAFAHLLYWFHERMGKLQEDHADLLAVGANAAPAQQTRKWIF